MTSCPRACLNRSLMAGAAEFQIDLESMLKAYYEVRDWDWETGFPTKEKLTSLGLEFAIPELYPKN